MSLFYVYMRWVRPSHNRSGDWSRILLTCESRYVADELFRALQYLQTNNKNRFTILERDTPQFWRYDTTDESAWETIANILNQSPLPASVQGRVMSTLLHDGPGREWPVVPVLSGRDWTRNRTYFIRSIRQPELYWFYGLEGQIVVSAVRRTKFLIRSTETPADYNNVLIRSDRIRISVRGLPTPYVYAHGETNKILCDQREWRFGDFLGNFGTSWGLGDPTTHGYITFKENGDLDDWELC